VVAEFGPIFTGDIVKMSAQLKLLMIEDSDEDAELVLLELERAEISFHAHRIQTADELRLMLESGLLDLIICDYSLPHFNAPAALRMVREIDPDLPFIVVSGTIGEDVAIGMLHAGANDYVLKSGLARLPSAIRREIRERDARRAQRKAELAAQQLAAIVQSSDDAITGLTLDGTITTWNPGAELLYGWSAQEAIGQNITITTPSGYRAKVAEILERLARGERIPPFETLRVRKDGTFVPASMRVSPVTDAEGSLSGVAAIARDITESKKISRTLARDAAILAGVRDSVIVTDLAGIVTYWNEGATRLFGWTSEEMVGKLYVDRFPEPVRSEVAGRMAEFVQGTEWEGEWQDYRRDGSRVWIWSRTRPVLDVSGHPTAILGLSYDVTERKLAEQAIIESEERFRQLAENLEQVAWINSLDENKMLYVSPAFEKVWGRSCRSAYEDKGSWPQSMHPDDRERVREFLRNKVDGSYDLQYRIVRPDGSVRTIRDRASAIKNAEDRVYRFAGVAEDVTDAIALEEMLRQSQKMESIGQLAGGVAHDFNNLLTAIIGFGHLAKLELPDQHPSHAYLDTLDVAAGRAADLTRQLLAFARKQVVEPKLVDLNQAIADTAKILRPLIGEQIDLQIMRLSDRPIVRIDPGQLHQVLINLAVNARDAMPDGGRISIETETVKASGLEAKHLGLTTGTYVRLRVADTGSGMTEETQAHIFEPFFTTKETGKGTGLGLATCFGIVEQNGGKICVDSAEGQGSRFDVYLPVVLGEMEFGGKAEAVVRPVRMAGTILLAEDEPLVREIAAHALRADGFTVIEAAGGGAALQLMREMQAPIDLLVTDVAMPGMGGKALVKAIRLERAELKVLYMSGYTDGVITTEADMGPQTGFIQKPFTPSELRLKVREMLESNVLTVV
jgi:two-component system cell cycle sensor histidine kinase/response regulator CckA